MYLRHLEKRGEGLACCLQFPRPAGGMGLAFDLGMPPRSSCPALGVGVGADHLGGPGSGKGSRRKIVPLKSQGCQHSPMVSEPLLLPG